MLPSPLIIGLVAGALALTGAFLGGYKAGKAIEQNDRLEAQVTEAARIIKVTQATVKVEREIVTKWRDRERVIEKETERVIQVIQKHIDPDCRMPDGYGLLLVAAANGVDPDGPGAAPFTGRYDCGAVLAATLRDLEAGRKNTEQLKALQERTREAEKLADTPGG